MIVADSICVSYGSVDVLRGVDLRADRGEIVALLGPNGSGKSTTLKALAGLVGPKSGTLTYEGTDMLKLAIRDRVRLGVTLVDQGRTLFASMSVEENLQMGAFLRKDKAAIREDRSRWLEFFPGLADARRRPAGQLSGGQQRMVAVARGMMARPSHLLLDEPSLGVSPKALLDLAGGIRRLRDELNLSVILVEQDIPFALSIADRVIVLAGGRMVLEDTPEALKDGERLRRVYFGVSD
jgi:branched-chain amino acid transport system ATP-binding protein